MMIARIYKDIEEKDLDSKQIKRYLQIYASARDKWKDKEQGQIIQFFWI